MTTISGVDMQIRKNQQGFGAIGLLILVGAVFLIGLAGYSVFASMGKKANNSATQTHGGSSAVDTDTADQPGRIVRWDVQADGTWKAVDPNPPTCPIQPMLQQVASLTDLTLVQYPGQNRDGVYKSYGTLTFNTLTNGQVDVLAPIDATVLRGAKYRIDGELQYSFDFVNSCGVMYRLGHLRTLTSDFQALAAAFPETSESDGKTTRVGDGITVKTGDKIATAIGLSKGNRPFFDFGIYDLRSPNSWAQNTGYIQRNGMELAGYGVCWFDWMQPDDARQVRDAAGNQLSAAAKNDYCLTH